MGRPREFCSQRCRQWDWVARQRASELQLSEGELVIARAELDALHDDLYVLACAVDDAERDLGAAGARPTSASSPTSSGGSSRQRARSATGNSPHRHPRPEFRHDVIPTCLRQIGAPGHLKQTVPVGRFERPGQDGPLSRSVCARTRVRVIWSRQFGIGGGNRAAPRDSGRRWLTPIIIVMSTGPHPTRKVSTYGED